MGWPRIQQMRTQALSLVGVRKPDGKGRVANGEAVMVHIVSGLTSRDGKVHQESCCCWRTSRLQSLRLCVQHAAHFSPSQADDRKKESDGTQAALQWPAVLGHEAAPHARTGSGSSSSPCTPAPQRAVLAQVRCCCPGWGGGNTGGSEVVFALGTSDWGLCKPAQRFLVPPLAAKFYMELYLGTADQG